MRTHYKSRDSLGRASLIVQVGSGFVKKSAYASGSRVSFTM